MNVPTVETMAVFAADQDMQLSIEHLKQAATAHAGMRAALNRLRALSLSFIEPTIEPATALLWIVNGGRSNR